MTDDSTREGGAPDGAGNGDRDRSRRWKGILAGVVVACVLAGMGIGYLLTTIEQRRAEDAAFPAQIVDIDEDELDPSVWGRNFPRQYNQFMRTRDNVGRTTFGGSDPYDKLEANPFRQRAWAGYAFELEYNNARGHYYAQIDQAESRRTQEREQPGTCIQCHAAEAPQLIDELGWDEVNQMPYDSLRDKVHLGTSCADCHNPETMELRITRQAFQHAMDRRGVDLDDASRQEMRSYVCAQCHVEYYFDDDTNELIFPWDHGLAVDDMEYYFDENDFADWTHAETNAPMIKIQHPEYELYTQGVHHDAGVACADCHMPYVREGGVKVSDHRIRSPLFQISQSCQTCHPSAEEDLRQRVVRSQERTYELLAVAEDAITDLMDAIVEAQDAGVDDDLLDEARDYHRRSQMRWDFIDAENSTGAHAPQEAARILGHSADLARRGERSAIRALLEAQQN